MNTKISDKGIISTIFFISQPMFLGIGISQILNLAEIGSIYSIIIGSIIGLFFLLLLLRLMNYEKDLTIFEKIDKIFGKFGKAFNFLITIIFILFFIHILWSINSYTQNKYLNNTPSIIILALFLIPVISCTLKGIKTISKVSLNLFIFTIFIIIFSVLNLTTHIEIQNLKPFFDTKLTIIIKNAFVFISYFVSPIFLMLSIPKNIISNNKKLSKYIIIMYFFSSLCILLLFIFIIGIFGIELSKLLYYPEFTLLKKINYFDFIQHIENILSAQWMYSFFVTSVTTLYFIKSYLKYLKIENNLVLYIIIFISLLSSIFMFKNSTIEYNFIKKYFVIICTIPLLFITLISNLLILKKK